MDFEKICMMFTMQEPFYGILLSSMERVPSPSCPTMGVGRSGNVFRLYYNPDFVSKLDIDTTLCVLKHECLHIALNHFCLFDEGKVSKAEHELRNIALDMEVNGYVDVQKMRGLNPVLAKDFGWDNFLGGREYYSRLLSLNQQQKQQQQQKNQASNPQQPCNGGLGGNQQTPQQSQCNPSQGQTPQQPGNSQQNNNQQSQSNDIGGNSHSNQNPIRDDDEMSDELKEKCQIFDDHSMWPDCDTDDLKQQMQQVIDDMLVFAAEEVEKGHGDIPGELVGRITELRKQKPRPVTDWKRYFRRYMGNEFTEFIRKSKKRESRRFPDAAGNRHRRKSNILVAIDTSGSVSMPEYREFFGQIQTLSATANFHVLECDTLIQHEYDYKGKPNETLHGGGGTSFEPVIDYFNERKRLYDALVYFTDGYASIPKNTPKETLWVISSNGDHDMKKYKINGASAVFIKKTKC